MYQNILPEEVHQIIKDNKDATLVDVRTPIEHNDLGYIKQAIKLPLQELPEKFNQLPMDKQLILICQKGGRSQRACEFLAMQGYTNLYNMVGGMSDWSYEVHHTS